MKSAAPKITWVPAVVEPRLLARFPRFERYLVRSCHGATVATLERRAPGEPWRALTMLPNAERVALSMSRAYAERAVERALQRETYMAPGLEAVVDSLAEEARRRSATKGEWMN